MFDRRIFFDKIRLAPFRGAMSQRAVDSINAILDEWERRKLTDLRWLAYMLSTVRGECGVDMWPVREGFTHSDQSARQHVRSNGREYAVEINGHVYYGRGLVQLTWLENYEKLSAITGVDLVNNPDLALNPNIAATIMFEGMMRGTYTGKKLSDYFNDKITDWNDARRIVNGTDKAARFVTWGRQFHEALQAAEVAFPPPPDIEPTEPKTHWLVALFRFLLSLFKRK